MLRNIQAVQTGDACTSHYITADSFDSSTANSIGFGQAFGQALASSNSSPHLQPLPQASLVDLICLMAR
jgi:hypothetical protein